jgi:hypothetical protein
VEIIVGLGMVGIDIGTPSRRVRGKRELDTGDAVGIRKQEKRQLALSAIDTAETFRPPFAFALL